MAQSVEIMDSPQEIPGSSSVLCTGWAGVSMMCLARTVGTVSPLCPWQLVKIVMPDRVGTCLNIT